MMTSQIQDLIDRWQERANDHRNAERSALAFDLDKGQVQYHQHQARRLELCIEELLAALDEPRLFPGNLTWAGGHHFEAP